MKTIYNLIALAENIARVYEISRVGGFTVQLIAGENSDGGKTSKEDIELLNSFYGFVADDNADIKVEVLFSNDDILRSICGNRCETMQDIETRIASVIAKGQSIDRTIGTGSGRNLLKSAIDKLNLSATETFKVIDIAEAIAKLAFSSVIKVEHIAEAVMYKSIRTESK